MKHRNGFPCILFSKTIKLDKAVRKRRPDKRTQLIQLLYFNSIGSEGMLHRFCCTLRAQVTAIKERKAVQPLPYRLSIFQLSS